MTYLPSERVAAAGGCKAPRLNPGPWGTRDGLKLEGVKILLHFEIIGEIERIETVAIGGAIRDIMRLQKQYGPGRWRKLKGFALVRLQSGKVRQAEVHWYEDHGVGRKKMKIKRFLD
jgi:hypothetical protein